MLNSRAKLVLAPLFGLAVIMVAGTAIAAPPASIDWITQPSGTVLTFTGTIGSVGLDGNGDPIEDANGNVIYSELYEAKNQASGVSGSGPFPGFSDSTKSSANGVFATTGNTFLSSLNWGSRVPDNTPASALKTHVVNNGNWLPNQNQINSPGDYGSPAQPANAAFRLQAVPGQPLGANGGDGGRVALIGLAGTVGSDNQSAVVTMAGDFNSASFSTAELEIQGTLGLVANYNGNVVQIDPQLFITPEFFLTLNGGLGRLDNDPSFVGSIIRGSGANSSDYLQLVHFASRIQVAFPGASDPSLGFNTDLILDIAFTAKANLRPGDNNFDGIVDVSDIQLIAANYLQTGKLRSGNANGDGIVDVSDIQLIAANYLQTTPPLPGGGAGAAVPEPASLVLLGVGLVGLAFVRRVRR